MPLPRTWGWSSRRAVTRRRKSTASRSVASRTTAGLRSHTGLLLFSTARHIVAIDPKQFSATALPPEVRIESVLADGKPMPPSAAELSFPPGLREVSIEYTAFNFLKPDRNDPGIP